jgi:hypothetical protein
VRVRLYADGRYAGSVVASGTRSDVAALYPKAGTAHGFSGYLRLAPGRHTVCSDVINYAQGDANPSLGCRTVTV